MIKLIIEIKEENSIDLKDDIIAIGTVINIKELGKNATKHEQKVSEILLNRLRVNEKLQFENYSKKSREDLTKELIKIIKNL